MGAARFLLAPAIAVAMGLFLVDWEHFATMGRAFQVLYGMDQSDFDNFINSYDVFDTPQGDKEDEAKVNAVYKVLVPLMALGSLKKYYIPPVMDASKNSYKYLNDNQVLFEQQMADTINLKPGQRGLDIGCGSGYIADTVQSHTGAKIDGINISPDQIATARSNAEKNGKLGKLLDFQVASMNDPLPFPDNTFDAVYVMQAICYVHDPVALMAEVKRVLKPGGRFSDLSIVELDNYDANNKTHYKMMKGAQRVSVVTTFRPRKEYEEACTKNGFSLHTSKLLGAADMTQASIDYFVPLGHVLRFAKTIGLMSKNVQETMDRMTEYGNDLVTGEREELFSINYWIVCEAPM